MITIWWIRRDLRLHDNPALNAAIQQGKTVLPVFILDPRLLRSPAVGKERLNFLYACLRNLDRDLRQRGSRLILRKGNPINALRSLIQETHAQAIHAQYDLSPFANQRDRQVEEAFPIHWAQGLTVLPLDLIRKNDGGVYTVFTPFSRTWKSMLGSGPPQPIPAPTALPGPPDIPGLPIPEAKSADIFPASEAEAHRRLRSFLEGQTPPVFNYFESRNRLDQQGTSCLSPYLRFGLLSPRQAYTTGSQALENAPDGEAKQSVQAWLNQLIWREFFLSILDQFPHVLQRSFRVKLANIHWTNNEVAFEAWCQGRTGFPVVDAAMRQLSQSGWMHNRARMITASFLVKDLLINWQWGERWFMQHLIDGDPANNNGGWQWTAGTGTDAAPYFRIFNPTLQGKKFDPQGDFVQQWIPELAEVPQPYLHEPWKMPIDVQEDASCKIGEDYPAPIVEHAWARERTLKAFDKAQSNSGSK